MNCTPRRQYLQQFYQLEQRSFHSLLTLIDFEPIRLAFTVTSAIDFEATFYLLVFHHLPYRRVALELDHACCRVHDRQDGLLLDVLGNVAGRVAKTVKEKEPRKP